MAFFSSLFQSPSPSTHNKNAELHKLGMKAIERGNADEAFAIFTPLAERGDAEAQCRLGFLFKIARKDFGKAAIWYRKAAEQGHAEAQCKLGLLYRAGSGVPKDNREAAKWYRASAEQGYDEGQYNWAVINHHGTETIRPNLPEAVRLYRLAAEKGHSKAQLNLGLCHLLGDGTTRDEREGIAWVRRAALQGEADAMKVLEQYSKR